MSTRKGFYEMRPPRPRPRAEFDDTPPAVATTATPSRPAQISQVDPTANRRYENSTQERRVGSTPAERSEKVPGYVPGYGVPATPTPSASTQVQWDRMFPKYSADILKEQADPYGPPEPPATPAAPIPPAPIVPPAPDPEPSPGLAVPVTVAESPAAPPSFPVPPTSLPLPGARPGIGMQTDVGPVTLRNITGLPRGQFANSNFVSGQNAPKAIARKPAKVDPYAL